MILIDMGARCNPAEIGQSLLQKFSHMSVQQGLTAINVQQLSKH